MKVRLRAFLPAVIRAGAALSLAACMLVSPAAAQQKSTVTAAISVDVATLDPGKISGAGDYLFVSNAFESLYGHDENGNLVPTLATEVSVEDDGLTYVFKLREGVTFHNGDPFTAEDVRFSWQRAVDPELKNPRASVVAANIDDVEIVDPLNVRIKLKKRDASFLENLDGYWFMVPKAHIESVGNDAFAEAPVGTGPFRLTERKIREVIRLEAFADHWGRVPQVAGVDIRIAPDEQTRLAQIQAGEVDFIDNISPFLAVRMRDLPGLQVVQAPTMRNMYVMMNATGRNERMKDQKVRAAFMQLVDQEQLTESIMLGFAKPAALNCVEPGIGCAGTPSPRIDPAQAKQALTEAGFDFSRPLEFIGLAAGSIPQTRELAEALVQRFSEAGVKTNLTLLEYGAWVQAERDKDPAVDMIFCMFPDFNYDPSGRLLRGMRSGSVFSWYEDPELDAMIDSMNDFSDMEARAKHISGIYQLMNDRAAVIPLWATDMIFVTRDTIEWTPTPNATWPVFWNIRKNG